MQTCGIENKCTMSKNHKVKVQNTLTSLQLIKIDNYILQLLMVRINCFWTHNVGSNFSMERASMKRSNLPLLFLWSKLNAVLGSTLCPHSVRCLAIEDAGRWSFTFSGNSDLFIASTSYFGVCSASYVYLMWGELYLTRSKQIETVPKLSWKESAY